MIGRPINDLSQNYVEIAVARKSSRAFGRLALPIDAGPIKTANSGIAFGSVFGLWCAFRNNQQHFSVRDR